MIDCPRCGALNASERKRCVRCQAWLPVTLPKVEPKANAKEGAGEPEVPLDDAVLDYSQSDKGGVTLVHRPEPQAPLRNKSREVPFNLDEEDIFTSAEISDDLGTPSESRPQRAPTPRAALEKPIKRRLGEAAAPASGRTPPPLPTREIATVVRKIARPEAAPPPGVAVAYVPGRGIVPVDVKAAEAPPTGQIGAASSARPGSPSGSELKARASTPAPPPLPAQGASDLRTSEAAMRLKAAVKAAVRARSEGAFDPPMEAPTLVSPYPLSPDPAQDLGEVVKLGALFVMGDEPSEDAPAEATREAAVERDKGDGPQDPSAEAAIEAALQGAGAGAKARGPRVFLAGDGEPDAVTRTEVGAILVQSAAIKLERLDADGSVHTAHRLEQGRHFIGREEGDILLSSDKAASPWHAQLLVAGGKVSIKDMGSLNGVHVRIEGDRRLSDKDSMLVGGQRFIFRSSWDPREEEDTVELGGAGYADPTRLLLKRAGGEVVGVYFVGEGLAIGRTRGELAFGADERMADEHAAIRRVEGGFVIRSLSARGVMVSIREEVALSDGQTFQLGRTLFRVAL